ncbi:hypothetical protein [Kitasatospora sp. NPDC059571]|uniref:hypothetical protein n=1 Tax=Kitasatospora sp. NPDC059571 TaxID=3346871 RepID=UPI00368C4BFD
MAHQEQSPPYPRAVRDAVANYFTDRVTEAEVALARAQREADRLRERRAAYRRGGRLTEAEAREVVAAAQRRAERLVEAGGGDLATHGGARSAADAVREGLRAAGHQV